MTRFNAMRGPGAALALFAAAALAGCASHNETASQSPSQGKMAEAGAAMQASGTMSQSDYVRIDGLAHTVSRTHAISDTDLDWTLTQLTTEKNSIARARAFNTLAQIRPMSAAQQAKIQPAIAPFLSSTDTLDQLGAKHVQKAIQSGG